MSPSSIRADTGDAIAVIVVDGHVDFDTAPVLKQNIVRQVNEGSRHLVIDLTGADFIDSTAIGVLVAAYKRLQQSCGSLAIACTNENILNVFEIVGLHDMIPIHRSRDDAISALAWTA
jgi:anti-sigma B factor antagonist